MDLAFPSSCEPRAGVHSECDFEAAFSCCMRIDWGGVQQSSKETYEEAAVLRCLC